MAGQPKWITRAQWESGHDASGNWVPPAGAELYADSTIDGIDERCIGEHSVTWNAPLRSWVLLYVCGPFRVEARTAPQPWGPWSPPTVMLSLLHDPGVVCTLIMNPLGTGCPGLADYWPNPNATKIVGGFFYAPFVMDRFTEDTTPSGGPREATIYWLVSTWNPYQVVVMKSTLQLAE